MTAPRVLLASPNYWTSPFHVGSHHLAREWAAAGWEVAYLSDPISPLHLLGGVSSDLRERWEIHCAGGRTDLGGKLWTFVPATILAPHNKPLLRGEFVQRNWPRWTLPNVVSKVRRQGFDAVDVLYIDSLHQAFWLDALEYRKSIFRIADFSPHLAKYTPAVRRAEEELARRADLVVVPSAQLIAHAESLGARRIHLMPNGVEFAHYQRPHPVPPEYRGMTGPIAVYVGVMPEWFHFAWMRDAAHAWPEINFVLIGTSNLATTEFAGIPNIHLLGTRPYAQLPGYLQHAHVGLMPFDAERAPDAVDCLNPQKMYQYLACGLPVVSSSWAELRKMQPPIQVCATSGEFSAAIGEAVTKPGDPALRRRHAARHDWGRKLREMLEALGGRVLARSA